MSIEVLSKNKAKLIVSIGSGKDKRRKTKTITYNGKKDLQKQYEDFRNEVTGASVENITIPELVKSYITHKELLGAEPTTIRGYNIALKRISFRFKRTLASECSTYHIEEFIAEMQNMGYAPKTIKNTISLMNASYRRGIKTGLLKENPCLNATLPKQKKKEVDTLEEESVVKLIEALDNDLLDYKVGYELCLFCGLRRSEVLGLKPSDINLDFKTITICRSRHLVNGNESIQATKTERSHRTLAVPDFLLSHICDLISLHDSYRFAIDEFLILDEFGRKRNPSTFTNHLTDIERLCGIQKVSVHGLRHTYATMLNASGIDIARISQELGHSNIGTTMNVYLHTFGNSSASSRGIADSINKRFENGHLTDTFEKEKTL